MSNLDKYISLVKGQAAFHRERADSFGQNPYRRNKHLETASAFEELLDYLQSLNQRTFKHQQLTLSLTPEDLEGLPEELVNELSISSADRTEFVILDIMDRHGGIMSLDQLLIQYYRETGEITKRAAMTNRLYRMAQKNLIYSAPQKKGVYCLASIDKRKIDDIAQNKLPSSAEDNETLEN